MIRLIVNFLAFFSLGFLLACSAPVEARPILRDPILGSHHGSEDHMMPKLSRTYAGRVRRVIGYSCDPIGGHPPFHFNTMSERLFSPEGRLVESHFYHINEGKQTLRHQVKQRFDKYGNIVFMREVFRYQIPNGKEIHWNYHDVSGQVTVTKTVTNLVYEAQSQDIQPVSDPPEVTRWSGFRLTNGMVTNARSRISVVSNQITRTVTLDLVSPDGKVLQRTEKVFSPTQALLSETQYRQDVSGDFVPLRRWTYTHENPVLTVVREIFPGVQSDLKIDSPGTKVFKYLVDSKGQTIQVDEHPDKPDEHLTTRHHRDSAGVLDLIRTTNRAGEVLYSSRWIRDSSGMTQHVTNQNEAFFQNHKKIRYDEKGNIRSVICPTPEYLKGNGPEWLVERLEYEYYP